MIKISHSIRKQILIVLSKQVLFFPMPENMPENESKLSKTIPNHPKPSKTIPKPSKTIPKPSKTNVLTQTV